MRPLAGANAMKTVPLLQEAHQLWDEGLQKAAPRMRKHGAHVASCGNGGASGLLHNRLAGASPLQS